MLYSTIRSVLLRLATNWMAVTFVFCVVAVKGRRHEVSVSSLIQHNGGHRKRVELYKSSSVSFTPTTFGLSRPPSASAIIPIPLQMATPTPTPISIPGSRSPLHAPSAAYASALTAIQGNTSSATVIAASNSVRMTSATATSSQVTPSFLPPTSHEIRFDFK